MINLFFVPPSFGEMYTSVKNMQQAISVEKELINHLRTYIQEENITTERHKEVSNILSWNNIVRLRPTIY